MSTGASVRRADAPVLITVGSIAEQTALWFNCGSNSGCCAHERHNGATRVGTAVPMEPPRVVVSSRNQTESTNQSE